MNHSIQYIFQNLKNTREAMGLSQRQLSTKSGVPQSHISKIESGKIDLRISSLVAIARVLELEITLIPRKHLSAVNSIIGSASKNTEGKPPRPAYNLDGEA